MKSFFIFVIFWGCFYGGSVKAQTLWMEGGWDRRPFLGESSLKQQPSLRELLPACAKVQATTELKTVLGITPGTVQVFSHFIEDLRDFAQWVGQDPNLLPVVGPVEPSGDFIAVVYCQPPAEQ